MLKDKKVIPRQPTRSLSVCCLTAANTCSPATPPVTKYTRDLVAPMCYREL